MANILIKDAVVVPMYESGGIRYFRGSVGIEGNTIAMVCSGDDARVEMFRARHEDNLHEIDGRGHALLPGLINTHCHTPMTLMRSYADDLPLMPWLEDHIWPFEAGMTPDDIRLGTELGVAEMLLGGTTCFLDMYFREDVIADVVDKAGMRAVLSTTIMGDNSLSFEKDLAALVERASCCGGRVTPMIACHSPYTVSSDNLLYAKRMAEKFGMGLNIHVAETREEVDIIREKFGKTPVQYLDDLGLLGPSTIAVHCVHLTDDDIRILAERNVSVSHNPQSNMKLASGISPVAKMVSAGVNVTIGTDGASSNNDLDMWEEMRSASFLQKVTAADPCILPAWDVLGMATVNAAAALGLGDKLGQIKEGMLADLIMVDMDKPHLHPQTDVVANLVYCAKSGDVDTVLIDGNVVVDKGRLVDCDLRSLYDKVDARVEEIRTATAKRL